MPDREPRHVQVHLVVGEHEANAFVLADRLAERSPLARVVRGHVVRAPAAPSQRMQCVRRAGDKRTART
jgi:hypothetical protein